MRKPATKLRREDKLWIVAYFPQPKASDLRSDVLIKGSVDLDRVEIASQIGEGVKIASFQLRIDDSIPVRIRPSAGSAVHILGEGHGSTRCSPFLLPPAYEKKRRKSRGWFRSEEHTSE